MAAASGLRWKICGHPPFLSRWTEVGSLRPTTGQEIKNKPKLAAKVQERLEFSQEEWEKLGMKSLKQGDYIKAGNSYFTPPLFRELNEKKLATLLKKPPSGLRWRRAGGSPPAKGRNLENPKLAEALTKPTGLKWEEFVIGSEEQQKGNEIHCEALAKALEATKAKNDSQKVFSEKEFKSFQVSELTLTSYILVGDSYFKPAVILQTEFTQKEWEDFGITEDLRPNHYVRSGDTYFTPAETQISLKEWDELSMSDLHSDDFIKVGDVYFRPGAADHPNSWDWNKDQLYCRDCWDAGWDVHQNWVGHEGTCTGCFKGPVKGLWKWVSECVKKFCESLGISVHPDMIVCVAI